MQVMGCRSQTAICRSQVAGRRSLLKRDCIRVSRKQSWKTKDLRPKTEDPSESQKRRCGFTLIQHVYFCNQKLLAFKDLFPIG